MWTPGKGLSYLILGLMLITQSFATAQANPANRVSEFKLANGLVVVVVPGKRSPVEVSSSASETDRTLRERGTVSL